MSDQQGIPQRVRALLAEQAAKPVAEISDEDTLEGLNLDSLDIVDLSIAVENEFGLTLTDEEFDDFYELKTVAAVIDFVQGKVAA